MISKWMVVPYQKPIDKPTDSKVIELDNHMTQILANPKLSASEKVNQYNQVLSKFLTQFNPDTYGESPTIVNLAGAVQTLVKKQIQKETEKKETPKPIKQEPEQQEQIKSESDGQIQHMLQELMHQVAKTQEQTQRTKKKYLD
jgi:hypothetical protein